VYVGSEPGRRLALRELLAGGLAPPVLVFVASQQRAAALLGCAWPAGAQRADCGGLSRIRKRARQQGRGPAGARWARWCCPRFVPVPGTCAASRSGLQLRRGKKPASWLG